LGEQSYPQKEFDSQRKKRNKENRMKERKTQKHKVFSIEEKNQIVLLYLDRHRSYTEITKMYGLNSSSKLSIWTKQYREFGTCVDRRGQGGMKEGIIKGRQRKHVIPLEEMTKKDLIEKVRMYEDIKNSLACVMNHEQSTTIKS